MKKNEETGEQREAWHRIATRCAAKIRERCGAALDRETAEKIARVFRAALVPRKKAGRKPGRATVRAAELRQERGRAFAGFAQIPADADGTIEAGIDEGARVEAVRGERMFGLALQALFRTDEIGVVELLEVLVHGTCEWCRICM